MGERMDPHDRQTVRLLDALADAKRRLQLFAAQLRSRSGVTTVHLEMTFDHSGLPFDSQPQPTMEAYVDAELSRGVSISWWLQLFWRDGWLLCHDVRINETEWQEALVSFPDRLLKSVSEVIVALDEAVSELIAAADREDLDS